MFERAEQLKAALAKGGIKPPDLELVLNSATPQAVNRPGEGGLFVCRLLLNFSAYVEGNGKGALQNFLVTLALWWTENGKEGETLEPCLIESDNGQDFAASFDLALVHEVSLVEDPAGNLTLRGKRYRTGGLPALPDGGL